MVKIKMGIFRSSNKLVATMRRDPHITNSYLQNA